MHQWVFITCIVLSITGIDQCSGNMHTITNAIYSQYSSDDGPNMFSGYTFVDRTLFTRNTTIPKSYVAGFRYRGDTYSKIIYNGVISSNVANTWGDGEMSNGLGLEDEHYLNAKIQIPSATDVKVDITVRGTMGMPYVQMPFVHLKIFRPRSVALICAINQNQPQTVYRELVFGKRREGDFVVHAEKNSFSATDAHLPRNKIEFQDDNVILTSAVIRLNSTMAIVFNNKVELTEHRFSGTIYGLKRDTIANTLIIYGYKT